MRDVGLADRIRAKGVTVVEVAGWKTRGKDGAGSPEYKPRGALDHHTAGSATGTVPSLNTCIFGRPGLPGPLIPVLQSREANLVDKAYVIASGKCNHGGEGRWDGSAGTVDSNYEISGLEVEHIGTISVHPARLETACRILAAEIEGTPGRFADMVCQHFEYARPTGRKSDFFNLSPLSPQLVRSRVGYWVGRTTTRPVDPTDPFAPAEGSDTEDDDVPHFHTVRRTGKPTIVFTSTGIRAEYAPGDAAGPAALSTKLEAIGFTHLKSLTCDSDGQYAVVTAPAPLTKGDLLTVADTIGAGFNVTKPGTPTRPNPGVFVADLAAIRDGAPTSVPHG